MTAERDRAAELRKLLHKGTDPVDLAPKSAYDVLTRSQVEDLARELIELRSRVNALLFLVVGSVLVLIVERYV